MPYLRAVSPWLALTSNWVRQAGGETHCLAMKLARLSHPYAMFQTAVPLKMLLDRLKKP